LLKFEGNVFFCGNSRALYFYKLASKYYLILFFFASTVRSRQLKTTKMLLYQKSKIMLLLQRSESQVGGVDDVDVDVDGGNMKKKNDE
jgi:hypothetical protein